MGDVQLPRLILGGYSKKLGWVISGFFPHEDTQNPQLEVSLNGGTRKSSIYKWVFHDKPSILGYLHFQKPLVCLLEQELVIFLEAEGLGSDKGRFLRGKASDDRSGTDDKNH